LGVEPGAEVMIVGAAVCIEIWHPEHWRSYLERRMPRFPKLYQTLSQ
jgi:MraZ protein